MKKLFNDQNTSFLSEEFNSSEDTSSEDESSRGSWDNPIGSLSFIYIVDRYSYLVGILYLGLPCSYL